MIATFTAQAETTTYKSGKFGSYAALHHPKRLFLNKNDRTFHVGPNIFE